MDALDATMWIARTVGDEVNSEVVFGLVAKGARAGVVARAPIIEREHD
jgi:hypothetical protein